MEDTTKLLVSNNSITLYFRAVRVGDSDISLSLIQVFSIVKDLKVLISKTCSYTVLDLTSVSEFIKLVGSWGL